MSGVDSQSSRAAATEERDLAPVASNDLSGNGAPIGEPEAWNANVAVYTPLAGHTPEPEPVTVSPSFAANLAADFQVEQYLAEERAKDLLRFSTAGSVDDGKSTLIGRLLYDTQSVYDDQIRSIEGKGTTAPGVLDLALLTDGLRAEREQGITIDVAYRYFSTARRRFIIADTPGHEQYTRNMATGASTADVAIVLIDARKGVLLQSRRHAYITALLGVRNIIVAVNKMDLVGFDEGTFTRIEQQFRDFFNGLAVDGRERISLHFVPVSALGGDNVVHTSQATPWYGGATLLNLLESIPTTTQGDSGSPFRMAVQRVVRPDLDFRGFAGQIASGTVRVGDPIAAQPSGRQSRVRRIVTFDGDLQEAHAPLSVTLTLQDEIDISRGDVLAAVDQPLTLGSLFRASLVWMDATPLETGRRYLLKQGSRTMQAAVSRLCEVANLTEAPLDPAHSTTLGMNGIGEVDLQTLQTLAFDAYADNRATGSFVLIDLLTNATVAAGMIRRALSDTASTAATTHSAVTVQERRARYGHAAAHVTVVGPEAFVHTLERTLFAQGAVVARADSAPAEVLHALHAAGVLTLEWQPGDTPALKLTQSAGSEAIDLGTTSDEGSTIALLRQHGVLLTHAAAQNGGTA